MKPNPIRTPALADVVAALEEVKADPYVDLTDGVECDVRLQVRLDGHWAVHHGLADYDTDHHGFWGADVLCSDSDLRGMAEGLINQVLEGAACAGYGTDCDCCPEGLHSES